MTCHVQHNTLLFVLVVFNSYCVTVIVFTVDQKCTIKFIVYVLCTFKYLCAEWFALPSFHEAIKLKSLLLSHCVYNLPSIYSCTASQPLGLCKLA